MRGDLRPAYLAWLVAVGADDLGDDAVEPPVPPGLRTLTAAQQAMVEFLRIDADLLSAAGSESAGPAANDGERSRRWVPELSDAEKDEWLSRAAADLELALGGELLRAFRAKELPRLATGRRTVGQLRELAGHERDKRERIEAARERRARERAEQRRQRRLDKLAGDTEAAWRKLEKLIEASGYDQAVALAIDLRDLAARERAQLAFATRFEAVRKRQLRRRGFFDRWKRVGDEGRW
jgi:hypothetical protein